VLAPELQQVFVLLRRQADSLPESLRDIEAAAGEEGVSLTPPLLGSSTRNVRRRIGRETYYFNSSSFFQTNHELLEQLIADAISETGGKSAVDLYCGVGLFTIPLARRFCQVIGVEANPTAARFARRNLSLAGLSNGKVVSQHVGDWLQSNATSSGQVEFLLLDPPRTGVEHGALKGILDLQATQISYVSCDPATLARDLKELVEGGYALDSISAFDMFPQTHHIEVVAHLVLRV
jgi:23S rRNA (uracil1939-C5)-methyltransferase